ncbi:thiopeptide-type bacteriocin biosynthesis protein [Chryseobacterium sp. JM1]|uniref:thiopeptide-type bacteriocin biosynthesis protein n=1 Tax=Chryseobacterium sp. JM1 TaxID=1233950 RepID=UPI0004E6B3C5|nr:thiopeptide-type bacteriocin biosynthesis protein [Chryseobacterium sp. JM1]KFF17654.1 lantibiotic dehydratase [Chryseobacterium sp. JM1]
MKVKRSFLPGGHWVYLKIYTGIKTADLILEEVIQPLTDLFLQESKVNCWFFIRYRDPASHIRLRLSLNSPEHYHHILTQLVAGMEKYVDSGEISTIVNDTYIREIERYGETTISYAETLFCHNSLLTLQFLWAKDEEKLIIILFYIDQLLSKINLPVAQKLIWIKDYNHYFKKEFRADKKLNRQLDKKYRMFFPKFSEFLESSEFTEIRELILNNIALSEAELEKIVDEFENSPELKSLPTFFQSIFHMAVNRLFISEQRLFEMVVYDYLHRYYKTLSYQATAAKNGY